MLGRLVLELRCWEDSGRQDKRAASPITTYESCLSTRGADFYLTKDHFELAIDAAGSGRGPGAAGPGRPGGQAAKRGVVAALPDCLPETIRTFPLLVVGRGRQDVGYVLPAPDGEQWGVLVHLVRANCTHQSVNARRVVAVSADRSLNHSDSSLVEYESVEFLALDVASLTTPDSCKHAFHQQPGYLATGDLGAMERNHKTAVPAAAVPAVAAGLAGASMMGVPAPGGAGTPPSAPDVDMLCYFFSLTHGELNEIRSIPRDRYSSVFEDQSAMNWMFYHYQGVALENTVGAAVREECCGGNSAGAMNSTTVSGEQEHAVGAVGDAPSLLAKGAPKRCAAAVEARVGDLLSIADRRRGGGLGADALPYGHGDGGSVPHGAGECGSANESAARVVQSTTNDQNRVAPMLKHILPRTETTSENFGSLRRRTPSLRAFEFTPLAPIVPGASSKTTEKPVFRKMFKKNHMEGGLVTNAYWWGITGQASALYDLRFMLKVDTQ